jgi:hypothetical protein
MGVPVASKILAEFRRKRDPMNTGRLVNLSNERIGIDERDGITAS